MSFSVTSLYNIGHLVFNNLRTVSAILCFCNNSSVIASIRVANKRKTECPFTVPRNEKVIRNLYFHPDITLLENNFASSKN